MDIHDDAIYPNFGLKIAQDIQEAMDTLRDDTVKGKFRTAEKLKFVLNDYLNPAGYEVVPDREKIYIIRKIYPEVAH